MVFDATSYDSSFEMSFSKERIDNSGTVDQNCFLLLIVGIHKKHGTPHTDVLVFAAVPQTCAPKLGIVMNLVGEAMAR